MKKHDEELKHNKTNFLTKFLMKKVSMAVIVFLATGIFAAAGIAWNKYSPLNTGTNVSNKTTRLGFEDIGEMATQTAYCTEVNVTEAANELFGIEIPFTQSKYVYSYDVEIKAGFDFNSIEWSTHGNTITVKLPKARILSSEVKLDTFEVYYEKQSIFRQITLSENNEAMKTLKQNAEENAIANGLLDNAQKNAETILEGFFANEYDPGKYTLEFETQNP